MPRKSAEPKVKIQVTLGKEIYDILDREARMLGTSVPAVLVYNANENIQQKQLMGRLPELLEQMRVLIDRDKESLSDEEKQ